MISFSAKMLACLSKDDIEAFYLLRITNSDGSAIYSSTTHFMDITLSNGNTYTADGLIMSVDNPQTSSSIDREQYKVALADPAFAQGISAQTGLVGKFLETRIGFINRSATPGVQNFVASNTYDFNGTIPTGWTYPGTAIASYTNTATTITNTVVDQNLIKGSLTLSPLNNYLVQISVIWLAGAWEGILYYANTTHNYSGVVGQYIVIPQPVLNTWTTITLDMRTLVSDWMTGGTITGLRFDFINNVSASVAIDSISIGKAEDYGQPYLDAMDTFSAYKGRIESCAYDIDTRELGQVKLTITGSSPIVNLDQKRSIYLSRDYIRKQNGTDSCCDQIYEGSGMITLKWGKK